MLDKLRSMAVFTRVAEFQSFRRAAEEMQLSASVVSHHIAQLESELGVQLLYRSTRHVTLTEQGRRFYESCRSMVQAAETALGSLNGEQEGGQLWVVAPAPFASGEFLRDVGEFCLQHPKVDFRLEFDDKPRNLIQEGIDLAIRFGPQRNSSLICRTLFSGRPGIFAAPSYLERFGKIEQIEDLNRVDWLGFIAQGALEFTGPKGEKFLLEPRRRIMVNNISAHHSLALQGMGVVELPAIMIQHDIEQGLLIELLPQWQLKKVQCSAIYPAQSGTQSLSRQFVDFILEKMQRNRHPPTMTSIPFGTKQQEGRNTE